MTKLQPYLPENFESLNYDLDELQMQFTALVSLALERIEEKKLNGDFLAKPITILYDGNPAGFFVLDFGNDKLELTEKKSSVLVRSLSINPNFQGKGIGKEAMQLIPEFLAEHYPETDEIVLAVNERNTSAYQLYLKAGYVFDGKTRIGRSGPQFLMSKKLN